MSGIENINQLLSELEPKLNDGKYVFVSAQSLEDIPINKLICLFREKEGITIIINQSTADELNLSYTFIAAWITLSVHSSLNAIGLTAAISTALTNEGISCNVVAGFYHDHIFVDHKDASRAIDALKKLTLRKDNS